MLGKYCRVSVSRPMGTADTVIATGASNPRSLEAAQIGAYLHCDFFDDPREAFARACALADENSLILICGSLYLASDMRSFIHPSTT